MVPLLGLLNTPIDLTFEHEPGRIWLRATLNGAPARAILDSGSGGLYAFRDAAVRAGGTPGGSFQVFGAGETPATGWNATGLSFGLEGSALRIAVPYILAPAPGFAPLRPIDVAMGFDFLLRYAVEVDYAASRLRLHSPWTYRPPSGFTDLRVRFLNRRPVVDAEIELPGVGSRKVSALLDTGAPGGVEITRRTALREGLDERLRSVPVEDAPGGLSGPVRVRRLRSVHLRLAGAELDLPGTVIMTEGGMSGSAADYDVLLGDAALRRFDVVFDYWHGRVSLRANGR